ncbi:MAG: hypothetical protein PF961_16000 [Planctomycetota bacterium]|jgi:hypothetical protein|nr:hypothetical protein [Planctomycetota bacterium]
MDQLGDTEPAFEPAALQQADLDPATLEQLFADISTHCRVIGCLIKGAPDGYAPEQQHPLETARTLLASRKIRGMQIRYVYQGEQWWDTLIAQGEITRLVRVCI